MNNILKLKLRSGFYSCCCLKLESIVDFYNNNKIFPTIDISCQYSTQTLSKKEKDLTYKFFKYDDNIHQPFTGPIQISSDVRSLQFCDYSKINYSDISIFMKKYYSAADNISSIYDRLLKKYKIDFNKTIAVCFRGNNKCWETNLPPYEVLLKKIQEVKSKYPDYKILLQSDEEEVYDYISQKYDIISFEELYKMPRNSKKVITLPPQKQLYQLQHFLAIMLILSKCSKVILNSGNIGLFICLYRNNINGVYQYLNPKKIIYRKPQPEYKDSPIPVDFWFNN